MFEESLVVSQIEHTSATKCWTMMGSLSLQAAIATVLIVLPLLHPEHLSFHATTPLVFTPLPAKPPFPQAQTEQSSTPTTQVLALPNAPTINREILLHDLAPATDEPSVIGQSINMSRLAEIPDFLKTTDGREPSVSAAATRQSTKPLRISEGVSAGMLRSPIQPIYPTIARAAHIAGSVVIEALISKAGTIESLHVVSGPEMLRGAALDAIRAARYQPFRLNGEPIEIQTTITVNFRFGT